MVTSLFLFCFSLLFFSAVLSRTNPHTTTTTTTFLDVSDSLTQAHHVLSFDPETSTPFTQSYADDVFLNSSSSSFSLPLHPRSSLRRTTHKDYRSLVLSRLARDSARVDSLTTQLRLATTKVAASEIRPEDLSTPIVSGSNQGSGEYFSRVGIGSPAKQFYMVIDTGSDINWIQCQPCADCYQQSDPVFDPTGSSSYKQLGCQTSQCNSLDVSACRNSRCLYQVSYGDGSYTVGDFVTDTVSFGKSGNINGVAIGCGHDNEGLFVGAAGLVGLGGGPLSLTSQIKATSFSYCLVDRDSGGSSSLDFNSAMVTDSVTAPLMKNKNVDTFYYVGLSGFSVGGHKVEIPPSLFQMDDSGDGGVIVDCGTAITRLQTQAYNSLRDAFTKQTQHLPPTSGLALFDTCYDLSSKSSVKVPTISVHFGGGKTLDLPAKNYMIPVDSTGTFCFAFAPTSSAMSIIGNVQQQGVRVTFDLANSLVGFSPNKC